MTEQYSDKPTDHVSAADGDVQGEGDYRSARKYQAAQHEFAGDDDKVEAKAREAANAIAGDEGDELEKARKASSKGETV